MEAVHRILTTRSTVERQRSGGLPTKLGDHFTVHNRYGEPCPRCGADLRRVSYEDYEVTYCPGCQTGGKVLADRRTLAPAAIAWSAVMAEPWIARSEP